MIAREWFERAKKEGFAIGAFNVDSLDIFNGICAAGARKKSPIMIEFSQGEVDYLGLANIVALVANAKNEYKIPILLNLDHSKKVDDCIRAIEQGGFDDVHFDGSELTIEENIAGALKAVEAAHAKGLLVEGEMDKVPGGSEIHKENIDIETIKRGFSDPTRAADFVKKTGIDVFAAVFGNVHGTFPNQPDLDFELLKRVREAMPETFLSMHGGSGISADQVREAIKVGGIVKVNVNTEIRVAFIDSLTEKINEQPRQYTYYKMAGDITNSVAAVVEGKIDVFGSGGKAV